MKFLIFIGAKPVPEHQFSQNTEFHRLSLYVVLSSADLADIVCFYLSIWRILNSMLSESVAIFGLNLAVFISRPYNTPNHISRQHKEIRTL
jgi:hypothetical protein